MANVNLICIGKLKEKYWKDAQAEYKKRLSAFCRLNIIEKKEVKLPKDAGHAIIEKARDEESDSILASCSGTILALSPDGEKLTSEAFSVMLKKYSQSDLSFAVGGSYGLCENIKKEAARTISFSDMTMPHQLFRIVLLEQIYRAFMISSGRTYHK